MYELTAKTAISEAHCRLKSQINIAISRAQECIENNVPYVYGGKTPDGLDCSGLITYCFPRLLPDGTEKQFNHLKLWIFSGQDISFVDVCDLVYFAEKTTSHVVSHVGVIEKVSPYNATIIHSTPARGGVVRDEFDFVKNAFRETYFALGIAKIRPFLFRCFLKDEINKELKHDTRINW